MKIGFLKKLGIGFEVQFNFRRAFWGMEIQV